MRDSASSNGRHGIGILARLAAVAAVLGSSLVLVPTAARASTGGCDLLLALLGVCSPTVGSDPVSGTCVSPSGKYQTRITSGSVYTAAFGQEFGRFEIRAKFAESDNHPGVQGALWLFAASQSTTSLLSGPSEIDVAEAYSRHGDLVSHLPSTRCRLR